MDINTLLKGRMNCPCGRNHTCEIEKAVIENGAVLKLPEFIKSYENILLVSDQNTYLVGGEITKQLIGNKLENNFIYQSGDSFLVPNEDAIKSLEEIISEKTELIIGVGAGVINDICKYVSFTKELPYYIVATAPSMDGYASNGAAMIIDNMKITYDAHVPAVIIGDVNMLKTAPIDMLKSGYGDIIGKYSALNDWKLSQIINDEYMCEYVYNLTNEMIAQTVEIAAGIIEREDESIQKLMEALVVVGIAMSFVGNSRPASGSEHHLSHFFEIVGLLNGEPYFNHGIDVAYSTVMTQRLREEILALDKFEEAALFNKEKWEEQIRKIYTNAAEGIIELQNKLGWYQKDYLTIYKEKFHEIRDVLQQVPTSAEIEKLLADAHLYMPEFVEMYGEEKIKEAVFVGKDLKNRYTVLWLYYELFYA